MAHGHAHDHGSYYTEQICTIVISMGFGIAGLLMALDPDKQMLKYMLVPKLHITVLLCGIALLAVSVLRTMTLAATVLRHRRQRALDCGHAHHEHEAHAEAANGCSEDHAHDHAECASHVHEHEHEAGESCCAHGAGHAHDHSWTPLRYVALLLPIGLFLVGLPNKNMLEAGAVDDRCINAWGATPAEIASLATQVHASVLGQLACCPQVYPTSATSYAGANWLLPLTDKGEMQLDFTELDKAAYIPQKRDFYTGHRGRLIGQMKHTASNGRVFTLIRSRMTCCAADVTNIEVFIIAPEPVAIGDGTWVEVMGQIQFQQKQGSDGKYVPVLRMLSIKPTDAPSNPFLY